MTQGLIDHESLRRPTDVAVAAPATRRRLDAMDWLRGLVMVIMALDHARDFFSLALMRFDPTDLQLTTPAYFLTRWITHYCAPTFLFLAGAGAYLHGSRGMSRAELSRFLLTRGLWLAFLEVTLITTLWSFRLPLEGAGTGVFWAIGWSMVALSVLVFLPTSAIAAIGIAMIAVHNSWDGIEPSQWHSLAPLWQVLHVSGGQIQVTEHFKLWMGYPLVPWIGVMACGYAFGVLLRCEQSVRRPQLVGLGLTLIFLFVALRAINRYGDPRPWSPQDRGLLYSIFSFLNCHKYPPSLLYLLMTLGPAIFLLGVMDRPTQQLGGLSRIIVTFGRVPFFFYVLHLALLHGAAVGLAYLVYGPGWLESAVKAPQSIQVPWYDLLVVYAAWLSALVVLYFPCRWFAGIKQRHRAWWLSYL